MTESFVYCWTDHKTLKLYIGYHKGPKDDGYICSSKLMKEEYKIRPEDFSRQIISEGSIQEMIKLENKLLLSIDAARNPYFYNQHNGNGNFYCKGHTQKTKEKISQGRKDKKHTIETRNKLSEKASKRRLSEKQKEQIRNFRKNTFHSEETKRKISESHKGKNKTWSLGWPKGKKHTAETIEKISKSKQGSIPWNKNKSFSEEAKHKMSEAKKGKTPWNKGLRKLKITTGDINDC